MRFLVKEESIIALKGSFPDGTLRVSQISNIPQPPINPDFTYNRELQQLLSGKQLLLEDIPFPLHVIQTHYENGYVTYRKGIDYDGKKPICIRCGNKDPMWFAAYPCSRCGESCLYCRYCLMMGRISDCTPLIGWNGPVPDTSGGNSVSTIQGTDDPGVVPDTMDWKIPNLVPDTRPQPKILAWEGTLSAGQQEASERVKAAIMEKQEWLIWAVCGAGKTEVLFAGIEAALAAGKRICIATPRTDVVLELTPRLKAAFPSTTIASLYGGSEDRYLYAPLTIATTHQLLRFYHAFDAIILDEVDAFPYTVEEALQHAAVQARKPASAMIYLTATPNKKWQQECRAGKRAYTTIPARFHRRPLPVPEFVWCGNWQKQLQKGRLPANVLKWIKDRHQSRKQALIFFPHIPLMEKSLPIIREFSPETESVHAKDPMRKEKVQKMRTKEIHLLLTTTILERGVTFPNIDVAVIGAEDSIFTESALVQIAGRAGRSKDYPSGVVTFFHYGKTDEMLQARKQIISMNQEGLKKGLIDG